MNTKNTDYLRQHIDILSFRDLAPKSISAYCSYMKQFIEWTENNLSEKDLNDVSWEELRSYFSFLKELRKLNSRTINVHIAQLRDFYQWRFCAEREPLHVGRQRAEGRSPLPPYDSAPISAIQGRAA